MRSGTTTPAIRSSFTLLEPQITGTAVVRLGRDLKAGERPQHVVPAGVYQAAARGRSLRAVRLHGGSRVRLRRLRDAVAQRAPAELAEHRALIERFTRA